MKKQIKITSPLSVAQVPALITVRGIVRPASENVQVLVKAGDGRWYQQDFPTRRGSRWCVKKVQIGNITDPTAAEYWVAALTGERIHQSSVDVLPTDRASDAVKVTRTKP